MKTGKDWIVNANLKKIGGIEYGVEWIAKETYVAKKSLRHAYNSNFIW